MPSLRIVYDVDGWAYYHRTAVLMRHAPGDFDVTATFAKSPDGKRLSMDAIVGPQPTDLILVLCSTLVEGIREELDKRRWSTRLVATWNNGWPHKVSLCSTLYRSCDHMIVNNYGAWNGFGRLPRTSMISNGVDLDVFKVTRPLETRHPKVIWAGSRIHRKTKNYDELMVPLKDELSRRGLDCEFMLVDSMSPEKRTPQQMAEWYNQATIYVCASKTEGTPNTALEAAACGCTVVSTPVGNMEQLIRDGVNGVFVDASLESILDGIGEANANYPSFASEMQRTMAAWDWHARTPAYYSLFRNVLRSGSQPAGKPDLSSLVTVFVTTVGAPTYEDCLARLKEQTCRFRLEIIRNVAPMSAAYQTMLDRCTTPYYIQLDEDMLLHPHAVETLFTSMQTQSPDTVMVIAELYDCHLERPIYGVKLFRHEIVNRYPFTNVEGTDVHQNSRMEGDGYRIERLELPDAPDSPGGVLGLHGSAWTDRGIYERYATQKRRYRRRRKSEGWFLEREREFFDRFLNEPTRLNFFALMGSVAGTLWPLNGAGEEKDWRTYERLPGFDELDAFLRRLDELNAPDEANHKS